MRFIVAKNRESATVEKTARYAVVTYSYGLGYEGKSAFFGMGLTDDQIHTRLCEMFYPTDFTITAIEDRSEVDLREIDNFFKV
jgi:hypothetical protein